MRFPLPRPARALPGSGCRRGSAHQFPHAPSAWPPRPRGQRGDHPPGLHRPRLKPAGGGHYGPRLSWAVSRELPLLPPAQGHHSEQRACAAQGPGAMRRPRTRVHPDAWGASPQRGRTEKPGSGCTCAERAHTDLECCARKKDISRRSPRLGMVRSRLFQSKHGQFKPKSSA